MAKEMPPIETLVRLRVHHSAPATDAVTVRGGRVYATAARPDAVLDLSEPPPGADSGIGPDLRRRFSALDALGADARGLPPLLVLRAGLDNPWLNAGLDRFVQAACAGGAAIELLNHPEGRHGFDVLDDDPRTHSIIRRTLAFLHEQLVP